MIEAPRIKDRETAETVANWLYRLGDELIRNPDGDDLLAEHLACVFPSDLAGRISGSRQLIALTAYSNIASRLLQAIDRVEED